uniref:Coiled-coil domain-containing protein 60 n=1 Tax=Schistosoma mansoni TaxID=6183 RepID=A0A5K4F379_SCHMA
MDCPIKVQTRNFEICPFTPPSRSEVRRNNYQRRCCQKQFEGLYAPTNLAYRELGHPLIVDPTLLIKSTLGYIPQRPNMLHGHESSECTEGVEGKSCDEEQFTFNKTSLTSESIEKSCQPLRPKPVGMNDKPRTYSSQSGSAYMERRRKRGLVDLKKVIQQSNDMTKCVKHGRSFFGILHQEIIQKVYNFWNLYNQVIEARKSRIIPPTRAYTLNEQNHSNGESINEIDEDDLLDEEPEIRELMNNLIANGCDLKIPLSKTKELSSEIKQSENHLTSATEHRRLKQYKQWYTESQRPFTPRFFNICKPDFGTELHSSQLCDTYKSITSKEEVKGDKKEKDYDDDDDGDSVRDIIFTQICCVLWIMEQMYNLSHPELDFKWRPISASWKLSSNDPTTEISEVYDQQNQADQVWHDFIYDTNYKQTKTKFRNQQLGSTNSLNSLQSGTLSSEQRCPTPSSSIMKSQSINKLTKFGNENTLKKNENQWINSINDIHKLSKETLSELVHQIEVEMDKETLKESELKLTTRGQITSKPIEKRPVKSHVNEVPKEFSSHKFMNLVNNIRKQLSIVTDENAIKLQDRLEFMKQIKPEICLAKYNNIPVNSYTHVAMQSMRRMALYDKATGELSKKSRQKNAVALWYSDILTDLSDLKSEPKFVTVLSKLKFYAQLSPSLFTVMSFTRVLSSLTLWEILSPASAVAIDFIRTRIVDMSTEEYLDWLCQTYPKIKELITHNMED